MRRQIYTLILILGVMLLFPLSGTAATKGIRIVPRSCLGEKRQPASFYPNGPGRCTGEYVYSRYFHTGIKKTNKVRLNFRPSY